MSKDKLTNLSYLEEISNGNKEFMLELIDMFFEQIPEYQQLLQELYDKKDWIQLGKTAHKAKSSILMMGIKDLAAMLKRLEENAKDGININEYSEIIAKFVSDSATAISELEEARKEITKI
ncbi:MAG: Hpt domain-containing protein [Bacteroidales bacterium]|jgi:HPt (histidine-containing phosphotransfer) domain-containing protein|nr:Hpt domain-containing protein [Bacteroidales bacterium]